MPLLNSYAITYDRCIGMSMEKVAIDMTAAPTESGAVYQFFSRTNASANMIALYKEEKLVEIAAGVKRKEKLLTIYNYIYESLLEEYGFEDGEELESI